MNLFEIDNAINEAIATYYDNLEENEGEITAQSVDLKTIIDQLIVDRAVKIENIALYIKNLEAEENAVAEQEKIFAARKRALANKKDNLKNYLAVALNGEKFKTPRVEIGFRKSSAVEIDDDSVFIEWAEANNKDLLNYKPTISKAAIKEALNRNEDIAGARIVERKSITIK